MTPQGTEPAAQFLPSAANSLSPARTHTCRNSYSTPPPPREAGCPGFPTWSEAEGIRPTWPLSLLRWKDWALARATILTSQTPPPCKTAFEQNPYYNDSAQGWELSGKLCFLDIGNPIWLSPLLLETSFKCLQEDNPRTTTSSTRGAHTPHPTPSSLVPSLFTEPAKANRGLGGDLRPHRAAQKENSGVPKAKDLEPVTSLSEIPIKTLTWVVSTKMKRGSAPTRRAPWLHRADAR